MLKLSQINIQNEDDIIVEVLEPIVYTKVGGIEKTDAIISRDKDNSFYLIAKVVKTQSPIAKDFKYPVGTFVIVTQPSLAAINFPIEGYDKPSLATVNIQTVFAIVKDEDSDNTTTSN